MKHINLSSWRGSITDWTKLNYIKGGLDDYYADIANIKGNYCYIENGVYKIEQNYNKKLISDLTWISVTYERFEAPISDMKATYVQRSLYITCPGYTTLHNQEAFDESWDLVIYNSAQDRRVLITDKQYTTVANFISAKGSKYITYPIETPQVIIVP